MATITVVNRAGTAKIEVRGTILSPGIGLYRVNHGGGWLPVHLTSGAHFGPVGFRGKDVALAYIEKIAPMADWTKPVDEIPRDVFLEAAKLRTEMMNGES